MLIKVNEIMLMEYGGYYHFQFINCEDLSNRLAFVKKNTVTKIILNPDYRNIINLKIDLNV